MVIQKIHAAVTDLGSIGGEGLGPFQNQSAGEAGAVSALNNVTSVVSSIIGVMTIAAGLWFIMNFLAGGIQWISAGGDKNTLQQAQQRLQNALIGLIIVIAGWSILALVGKFLNFDILLSQPGTIINQLTPRGN